MAFGAESANLGELPCCQRNSMNPARGHDQFRMQLWSGFYKTTWASYGQVRGCSHESFRHAPRRTRDAHLNRRARAGRAERSSRRRRSERRRVLPLAASNGGARHREPVAVRRRGRSRTIRLPADRRRWQAASAEHAQGALAKRSGSTCAASGMLSRWEFAGDARSAVVQPLPRCGVMAILSGWMKTRQALCPRRDTGSGCSRIDAAGFGRVCSKSRLPCPLTTPTPWHW